MWAQACWLQITWLHILTSLLSLHLWSLSEYEAQLAPAGASESDMASSSYLEPNHNHSAASGCGVKSRSVMPSSTSVGTSGSAGGIERPPGSMDRVLKIFHYFETNSEPCTWASNIRHGDATDVRVRHRNSSYNHSPMSQFHNFSDFHCPHSTWFNRVLSRR